MVEQHPDIYIAEKQSKLLKIRSQISEVQAIMKYLNSRYGDLQREAYAYECDIVNYKLNGEQLNESQNSQIG